jgi:glutathione S-transferase
MKLYYATGAGSLAGRISLYEAGLAAEFERVDLQTKTTETGANFMAVSPKGHVPVLVLDNGEIVTENIAVLSWIASQAPNLAPAGPLGQIRLIEALTFISAEVHNGFKPLFALGVPDTDRADATNVISRQLEYVTRKLVGPYLFGSRFTVVDAYLFVNLRWANQFRVPVAVRIMRYFERVMARESVREALAEEGLAAPLASPKPRPRILDASIQ